jgi:signal transduction histidine kinase
LDAPGVAPRRDSPDSALLRRVRWRLVAWSAGTTFLVLLVLGSALYLAVANSLAASGRRQLEFRADQIEHFILEARVMPMTRAPIGLLVGGPASGTFAFIIGPDDRSLGPQDVGLRGLPDPDGLRVARDGGVDVRSLSLEATPVRVLSLPVLRDGATYVIQVIQDITGEQRLLDVVLTVLLGGGLIAMLGSLGVGTIYARRALVPIRESLRRQREFAADASHEFRTPLAVIQSSLDDLEQHRDEPVGSVGHVLEDIHDEVQHLTALVSDLLLLARTDSGVVELERLPVDLAEIAEDAVRAVTPLAARRQVAVVLDPEPTPGIGDHQQLRQLVMILADNAIAHSPAGGTVTVRVRRSEGGPRLQVDDEGPGIPAEDLPRVFDRFWRGPGAPAGGTGLGLAIASWIARQHRGSISVSNRTGPGASFEVSLPARPEGA